MTPDFNKNPDQLLPAIIQDVRTAAVLMLGYMNEAAYTKTLETRKVTFFSRTKNRLWTKGETSGNYLQLVSLRSDCDRDTLLLKVLPAGPVCHKGTDTCWGEANNPPFGFLSVLEQTIKERREQPETNSYIASLFQKGINTIAQKVGEEAVEVIIEAKDDNNMLFLNESADLLFHYLILLQAKGFQLQDVVAILEQRAK
ncbi:MULTISPECIES: bifunctional phosphoribosyl-AMP cyclohydrolase/phosphoribosyl-ATP diphosphatase HisIE [unclassified Flavobacterium]|uniref:bifunctional phosphoribosyl-AMP cyclohydrolase/phosphoribosyl-ATP diphosphatase HisIE n=1 Tax=unclassified Flavobacterium TaxID=196869 RepID=UPI0009595C17|nr:MULTISPECIES: bifunctional phosphoribosyl-AMP cyclohydrolase/phosphoribosyl-ATP diphosphatase HisIE [unclassified Flavobacterium]MBN9284516.1 bifunctional phosphoribosyl-AMP cyclohydrolase/phosphoribosyl-ATP diphosphatase HisIE [Flavobacterium sp.]OJV72811.1 MAG: bifunctional phosphoribosyl-AMP cyclohydrolase/phosphoribosyl-ATP diphosphatase [Flavobacterium sp. 40-81]